jgi:hypothetical protein
MHDSKLRRNSQTNELNYDILQLVKPQYNLWCYAWNSIFTLMEVQLSFTDEIQIGAYTK